MLILAAFANGFAEETVVVGYPSPGCVNSAWSQTRAVWASSAPARHLPPLSGHRRRPGERGDGPVFGYAWCRSGRLWPLVIAHGIIDAVAFVGYVLLSGHAVWLR